MKRIAYCIVIGLFITAGCTTHAVRFNKPNYILRPTFLHYNRDSFISYSEYSLFEKGRLLYEKGEYTKAADVFKDIISVSNDKMIAILAFFNAGLCYYYSGHITRAIKFFRNAADLCFPRSCADIRETLAYVLLERGKVREAEKVLYWVNEKGLKGDVKIYHEINRALINSLKGESAKARQILFQYLTIEQTYNLHDLFYIKGLINYVIAETYRHDFLRMSSYANEITNKRAAETYIENLAKTVLLAQKYYMYAFQGGYQIATSSLFRLGEIYQNMYFLLLNMPFPAELSPEEKMIYREELKKELSPILQKAIIAYRKNLELFSKFRIESRWVKKTIQAIKSLDALTSSGS